jgi:hypothetical protein
MRIMPLRLAALAPLALGLAHVGEPANDEPVQAETAVQASAPGQIQTPPDQATTPAMRYGRLDRATCEAELHRRQIAFTPVADARGVLAPVRLNGPIRGVTYHSSLPASQRATSPYEILDCRLVLALDDFSAILAKHDIVEVIHFSVYRPPSARFAPGRLGHQHDGALAIDAGWFKRKDGTTLQVERDFHGRIGASTCGPGTGPSPATPDATALRSIVCEAATAHLFNVELTPDYNWQHRNHFHLEVTPSVRWFLVH